MLCIPKWLGAVDAQLFRASFLPPSYSPANQALIHCFLEWIAKLTCPQTVTVTSEGARMNNGKLKGRLKPQLPYRWQTANVISLLDDAQQQIWLVALLPSIRHLLVPPQLQTCRFH